MSEVIEFPSRASFRQWLCDNCLTSPGVWLLLGKPGGPKTIKANEALEEALCFGWIDGQMQSIDEHSYKKYFSIRRQNSNWSEKNKALAEALDAQGKMTDFGREKIREAKENGQWVKTKPPAITDEHVAQLAAMLEVYTTAHANYLAMSPSVKRTYARAYFDAKTQAGKESRFAWIVDRLEKNLKPM